MCPICLERVPDDLDIHVEMCLSRSERNNGNSNAANVDEDDINIDVEGEEYEEYQWAGQIRIRASSLLEGGYSATGKSNDSTPKAYLRLKLKIEEN